jgi:hypothetical protein
MTPEDHPDYGNLMAAQRELEILINEANEKQRVIDNKMLVEKINNNLVFRDDEEVSRSLNCTSITNSS